MTFDKSIEKAMWIFSEYKRNLEVWAKEMWRPYDVQIAYVEGDFSPKK